MARPYERLQLVYHHVASVDQARMSPAGKAQDKGKRTAGWSSRLCDQEDLTASTYVRTLEPDDIAFFKEHGFLIKKRLLDPVKVAEAMSRVWDVLEGRTLAAVPGISVARHQHSVSPGISRSHPASWVGASVNHDGHHSGGLRSLGHLDWMRELVPYDTNVRAIATAMLGPLRENRRVRGVYPIFPSSSEHLKHGAKPGADPDDHIGQPGISADLLGPHNDGQVCQLNAMAYIADVAPRSGGTTFWPGSHKRMYYAFEYESNGGPGSSALETRNMTGDSLNGRQLRYKQIFDKAVADIEPVEIHGEAGHGRMLHSAGIHRGSSIRFAVPVDFQQDRPTIVSPSQQWPAGHAAGGHRAYPDDTPPEMVKQFGMEWHKDTVTFVEDLSPQNDMWTSWAI